MADSGQLATEKQKDLLSAASQTPPDQEEPTAAGQAQANQARELLRTYLSIYDTYHNHKETTAFGATALYLTGTGAMFFQQPFWENFTAAQLTLLSALWALLAVTAFLFVDRQLKLRRSAGHMFTPCSRLTTTWLTQTPAVGDLKINPEAELPEDVLFKNFSWPNALWTEIDKVRTPSPKAPWWKRIWWARLLTFSAMGISTLLLLFRFLLTWETSRTFFV